MRILPTLLLLLLGVLCGAQFSSGLAQDLQLAPQHLPTPVLRTPYWNSINVKDAVATMLLEVPKGKRFVLTDLWFLSREDSVAPKSPDDRIWLETQQGSTRRVVFDSPLAELPYPLRWQTGVVFQPGEEMWIQYRSAKKTDLRRRIHFSGYFENISD